MSDERFSILFDRMTRGELSPAEKAEIGEYFASGVHAAQVREMLDRWYDQAPAADLQHPDDADRLFNAIVGRDPHRPEVPVRRISAPQIRRILAWTAACAVVLAASWYFLQRNVQPTPAGITAGNLAAVAPGKTGAILTLADGSQLVLDSLENGIIAQQNGAQIKLAGGQLKYDASANKANRVTFNTVTTPRGRQFRITLPDGTRVWLDAASSITFPTAFSGATREVSMTGQAYYEVSHGSTKPFLVEASGQTIRDIGTAFNIHTYSDEPAAAVTLTNGAIAVAIPGKEVVLNRAGQQIRLKNGALSAIGTADISAVLAWKDGIFNLSSADIPTVMRQIARWYDVDIVFVNGIPTGHISGEVPRDMSLSSVLQLLQASGIRVRLDGRKLIVEP